MGEILNSYIFPHPPIIIPGIGGGRENDAIATIDACRRAAREIAKNAPSTILISSPHAPCFRDFIVLSDTERLKGDFGRFGHPEITMDFQNNAELASEIIRDAQDENINAGFLNEREKRQYNISDEIDHGAMVPLFFVLQELELLHLQCKLVHISTPFLPLNELHRFGKSIQKTIIDSKENIVYIASGDLSHRLTQNAPAGYSTYGKVYDAGLVEIIRNGDVGRILSIQENDMEEAGECGTRSFAMLFGVLDGFILKPSVYSYEGPFGVGYLVARMEASPDTREKM